MKIAIVGLGYVGLPLSIQFARSGVTVLGLDVDAEKVELLNKGRSYIKHIDSAAVAEMTKAGLFYASTDFGRIREVEAVIICVPTPLNKNREPDISFVINTGQMIAPHLAKGTLVVLESTTYPGTTEDELRRVLEENAPLVEDAEMVKTDMLKFETLKADSSLNFQPSTLNSPKRRMRAGVDFHLAFSPEREDPANEQSKVKLIPKVIGVTPALASIEQWRFTAKRSTHLWPSHRVGWLKRPSCSRTSSAA
jgi:UDP-N-acetyl-D-glucosamine dehydrogenase